MCVNAIADVIEALGRGAVIVYPTDTLYALGADIFNDGAVRKVFALKQRPLSVPLPVAVPDLGWMRRLACVDERIVRLADRFLPGLLTVVLRKKTSGLQVVTSGQHTIAVRIPQDDREQSPDSRGGSGGGFRTARRTGCQPQPAG